MDDPLSAVDQTVGRRLFDRCIKGYLSKKIVIFVTNQLQYLSSCDMILYLKDTQSRGFESYQNLLQLPDFAEMMENVSEKHKEKEIDHDLIDEVNLDEKKTHKLIDKEDKAVGEIPFSTYWTYYINGGPLIGFFTLLFYILVASLYSLSEWFLSYWIDNASTNTTVWFVGILGGIYAAMTISFFLRGTFFAFFSLNSSTNIHNGVFKRVMNAPMSFFDSTPLGRILNRLSQDQDKADITIPEKFSNLGHYGFWSIASIITIIASLPWFSFAVLPTFFVFRYLQRYYISTAREVKRLDSMAVSPLLAHISATIIGLTTIRSYGVTDRFVLEMKKKIKRNTSAYSTVLVLNRWIGVRLDVLGIFGVLMVVIFCLIVSKDIGAGLAGLVISYSLTLIINLQWAVRIAAEAENEMTSYQRLTTYESTLLQEAPRTGINVDGWPSSGSIKFENVFARYKEDQSPVLKGISFTISSGEKIGIVGRTGSGKSTITLALFRILEIYEGTISIDGVDISKIGLNDLRSSLSIIPQDPVLFIGTIRSNLDPFNEQTDETLWNTLEKVHLSALMKTLPLGLESPIHEKGSNLSLGQRQLICIARALLRKSKILVLDEATASVDYETDYLIQKTIKESFSDFTVLTIAHRLHTVIHSDRILVIDNGNLVEFDTPQELLERESKFSSFVKETDIQTQAYLYKMASEKSQNK
uniref:Uncharacterized protein n=1 Tax=Arcella intermedia TaxID=1963864 RepID=A0A6B2KYX3_9EUKA